MRQVKKQPLAVVIGMPGAGKTKVGKLAATMLNLPFRDADNIVEQETGKSIAQIIEIDGESIFRQIECEIVCRTLNEFDGGIFALGGGAPMTSDIHEALLQYRRDGGTVIYLDADCDEASSRAARGGKRPLLANDGKSKWMELYAKRHLVYEQLATITIRSHQTIPQKVARRMVDALREKVVHVSGFEPYDVRVGFDVYSNLRKLLGDKVLRVALIHSRPVQRHADHIRTLLRQAGYIVSEITIPDAEFGKTVNVAQGVWNRLAEDGFTRSDAIVGLGGGAATDLAGFIAATWMRGIRYVNCPTSLLAMVDASTGGKTGINLSHGKNLVGSFFSPVGVLADLRTLNTLLGEIFIEGLGEVAKCGFIDDPEILRILENHAYELKHFDGNQSDEWLSEIPSELIVRSVDVKSNFVSVDLKEAGPREFLNYGHTLGHAIEQIEHFRWRHGQAVSVGMVFAAELAHNLGMISSHLVDYHRELLSSLGLQTTWSNGSWQEVLDLMHKDKKARGHQLRFVVLEDIGRPVAITDPPIAAVHDAFKRVRG